MRELIPTSKKKKRDIERKKEKKSAEGERTVEHSPKILANEEKATITIAENITLPQVSRQGTKKRGRWPKRSKKAGLTKDDCRPQ